MQGGSIWPAKVSVSFRVVAQGYARHFVSEIPSSIDNIEVHLIPSGGVSGRVVDGRSGEPVREARVILNPGSGQTKTGKDGRFFIDGLAPGSYRIGVIFTAAGYGKVSYYENNITVEPQVITDNTEIVVKFGDSALVTGRITGKVNVSASGQNQISNRVVTEHITVASGDTVRDVDLQLIRRISMPGIVRMPDGSPADGAIVTYAPMVDSRADKEGRVTMEWLTPLRAHIFEANLGDKFEAVKTVTPRPGESFEMVLQPVKFYSVSGIAVYDDGSPAAGVPLRLHSGRGLMSVRRDVAAVTGEDGRFTVDGLRTVPEVNYNISGAHGQVESDYFKADEDFAPIRLVFRKETHRIEGNVVDSDGNPVADARIFVWLDGGGHWEDVTGDDGAFLFDDLYATEAEVAVRHYSLGSRRFEAVPVDTLRVFVLTGE